MTKRNGIAVLRARLTKELDDVREVVGRVASHYQQLGDTEVDDLVAAGFAAYLHSFYNGVENIFKVIAEYLDDFTPNGGRWHQDLLEQMALEIPGVRPAILSSELAETLREYLELRHFFRHSYSFQIEWEKLKPKVEKLNAIFTHFETALVNFIVFLDGAANEI